MAEMAEFINPKNILLIIDPQNDFVDIPETYAKRLPPYKDTPFDQQSDSAGLPVPGAKDDLDKLAVFLEKNGDKFDEIHVSLDSHTKTHIGHIGFWEENPIEEGYVVPRPLQEFYVIDNDPEIYIGENRAINIKTTGKIEEMPIPVGKVKTKVPELQEWAYKYIKKMQEDPNKPIPCLWAEHCIKGSDGWKVYEPLLIQLNKLPNKVFYHEKGTNDLVEMYSIFSAEEPYEKLLEDVSDDCKTKIAELYPNVTPVEGIPDKHDNTENEIDNYNTTFNDVLFSKLIGKNKNNKIFVCGEAKSHCVKTSLEDMLKNCDKFEFPKKNIYVFEDMTSLIPGYEIPTKAAYTNMIQEGLRVIQSTDFETEKIQTGGKRRNKTSKKSKATKKSKKSKKSSKTTRKHRKTHKSKH